MSDTITFKHDFNDIIKYFDSFQDLDQVEKEGTYEACKIVAEELKNNLSRSSDKTDKEDKNYIHMKDSIFITKVKQNDDGENVRRIYGGKVHYKWKWLENGTSKMNPTHFITKSLKATEKEVQEAIEKALRKKIEKTE